MVAVKLKNFIINNKEVLMFLAGFGIMHLGWYNLQRNSTLNKALAVSREKETLMQYKRLEQEINENWSSHQQEECQPQKSTENLLLTAANSFMKKPYNT